MPTYEYLCSKCEQTFDVYQPITDKPLAVCPRDKCGLKPWGKGKVKRAIGTGAGILFKGSGFYITDYRSDSYKEAAKKDAAPAAGSESKPAAKADGKSGSKPDSKPAKPKADGK